MSLSIKPKARPERIKYFWGDDHLAISIRNHTPARIRALYWAELVFTLGMTSMMLFYILPSESKAMNIASIALSSLLYLLASYRFLSRMFFTESLLLDKHSITIMERTLFNRHTRSYEWHLLGALHYAGRASKTDHPLKGKCFDYFGFETQEHLIQNLHQDGNLYFNCMGSKIRFAKDVYSWHAEEMVSMMKLYAGGQLHLGPEWAEMQKATHEWDDAY